MTDTRTRTRMLLIALGLLIAFVAAWFARPGLYSTDTAALAGRAMLGTNGKADLSTLLATYPPIPYLLLSALEPVARLTGLSAPALLTGLLAGGFFLTYCVTLRRALFGGMGVAALALLLCLHPFMLFSVASGPEALLLIWGVWLYGLGLFGFRADGSINDLIMLTLSLPLMALTSLEGLIIAVSAIPFLLLAVPPQLLQRAYGSVYIVLLFPLVFAGLSLAFVSLVMLHDPFAFVSPDMLYIERWSNAPWYLVAAACMAAIVGAMMILPAMILRGSTRRPLQNAAGALIATLTVSTTLLVLTGHAQSALAAPAPGIAGAAVASARWPRERHRELRVATLMAIGLAISASTVASSMSTVRPLVAGIVGSFEPPLTDDARLAEFLVGRNDVMFDAIANPAVVGARGGTGGLVTATDPAFTVAILKRKLDASYVVSHRHDPGYSDDLVVRIFPKLHLGGAPGYRLAYENDKWRVWERQRPGETQ